MPRPENQNWKEYTGYSSQGIRYPLVPLLGSKNEVVAPKWCFHNTSFESESKKPFWCLMFCTKMANCRINSRTAPKIVFWKRHLGATTSFLSPTEALEPSSCIVRNLLCILTNFDIQVWASRSHSKGCFSCPKKKTLNTHISKSWTPLDQIWNPYLSKFYNSYSLASNYTQPYQDSLEVPKEVCFKVNTEFIAEGEEDLVQVQNYKLT